MSQKSRLPKKENILLAKKVKMIYTELCNGDISELLELFSDPKKAANSRDYALSRRKVLQRMMREETAGVRQMASSYDRMAISKLRLGDEPLFGKRFFFESSEIAFRRRLMAYLDGLRIEAVDLDRRYRHLYLYGYADASPRPSVHYYEIEYLDYLDPECGRGLSVRIWQGGRESAKRANRYEGCVEGAQERVSFHAHSAHDWMTLLFNTELAAASADRCFDQVLYGMAIGIDDLLQKIPVAKKAALMPHRLEGEELERMCLVLNETACIDARDNLYALRPDFRLDRGYLQHYRHYVDALHRFFSCVKDTPSIDPQLSDRMVFTEFHAFSMLYDKYAGDQDFFLSDRKRIVLELLRFAKQRREDKICMVLPLYDDRENIFLYEAIGRDSIREMLITRARLGVAFEILFVVKEPGDYRNDYMEGVYAQLAEADVLFGFVDAREAEGLVHERDFIFSSARNFAIVADTSGKFTVTRKRERIRGCIADFQRLRELSFSYEDILDDSCMLGVHDEVLQKMMGRWYGYFYGTLPSLQDTPLLWQMVFEILPDYRVVERRSEGDAEGRLEVSESESAIVMIDHKTHKRHFLTFDNRDIDKLFGVVYFGKSYSLREDVVSVGLFSRERLPDERVAQLLGSDTVSQQSAGKEIADRIRDYLAEEVSSLIQPK